MLVYPENPPGKSSIGEGKAPPPQKKTTAKLGREIPTPQESGTILFKTFPRKICRNMNSGIDFRKISQVLPAESRTWMHLISSQWRTYGWHNLNSSAKWDARQMFSHIDFILRFFFEAVNPNRSNFYDLQKHVFDLKSNCNNIRLGIGSPLEVYFFTNLLRYGLNKRRHKNDVFTKVREAVAI